MIATALVDEVSSTGVFRYQVMHTSVSEVSPTGVFGVVCAVEME